MDWTRKEIDAMELSVMGRILASEEAIVPSSGFLSAVMEKVEHEAKMPAPIPFPWKRALPGFMLTAGVFGWGGVELVRMGIPAMKQISLSAPQVPTAVVLPLEQAGWVALALGLSLVSWLLARKLAGGSGLL